MCSSINFTSGSKRGTRRISKVNKACTPKCEVKRAWAAALSYANIPKRVEIYALKMPNFID